MSREIMFRAWDSKLNQFIEEAHGFHVIGEVTMFGIIDKYMALNKCDAKTSLERLGDISVQQFTGLKDKNGVDVYEGDRYQVAGNRIYEIRYCEGGKSNHEWYGGMFILYIDENTFFPFDEYAMKTGCVIGNIYDPVP